MKELESLDFLPPNLRKIDLYNSFSEILDFAINNYFTVLSESNRNIYNPFSKHYSPEYIIKLLGGDHLLPLLDDSIDKNAISVMLPKLLDIKGTEDGIITLLKLLKIDFKNLLLLKDRNGCGQLTIVVKNNSDIPMEVIFLLEKLSRLFSTQCAVLTNITSCQDIQDKLNENNTTEWDLDIGIHSLDFNFRLDRSLLGRSQGTYIPASRINVKLCNTDTNYLDFSLSDIFIESVTNSDSSNEFNAFQSNFDISETLILDESTSFVFKVESEGFYDQI